MLAVWPPMYALFPDRLEVRSRPSRFRHAHSCESWKASLIGGDVASVVRSRHIISRKTSKGRCLCPLPVRWGVTMALRLASRPNCSPCPGVFGLLVCHRQYILSLSPPMRSVIVFHIYRNLDARSLAQDFGKPSISLITPAFSKPSSESRVYL